MGVAKKFILGAAGLIITILLIYAGLSIYSRSKQLADGVTEGQDQSIKDAKEYGILKYDGYVINGATAINYIKTAVTDYEVEARIIKNVGGSLTTGYISTTADFTSMRDVTQGTTYVNPLKEYKCTVYRDSNDLFSYIEVVEQ